MSKKVEITYLPIDEVIPYKNNPRDNDKAVDAVADSIHNFGFKVPIIVDKDNVIVTGHTRLKAGKKLGMEEVPTILANDLTPEQVKAFRLADNKVAEGSSWNDDLLRIELEEIGDMFTGFSDDEFDKLFEGEEVEKRAEIEFTEELGEENNYVVLFFDNKVDWVQAQTVLGLKPVHALDSKEGFERKGLGRVMNGTDFIEQMIESGVE